MLWLQVGAAGGVAGSAVVFRQELVRHDGERLASGVKYLMRTDVVYKGEVPRPVSIQVLVQHAGSSSTVLRSGRKLLRLELES